MRLADRIIAGTRKPNHVTRFFVPFADALREAVPFEIDEDVGRIATAIKNSDAKKLLSVHEHCRLPFKKTWIEWLGPSADFGQVRIGPELNAGHPRPERCGALFEAFNDELSNAMITLAWCHPDGNFNVSPLTFLMTWSGDKAPFPGFLRDTDPDEMRQWFPKYRKDSDEDLRALDGRVTMGANPHMWEWWATVFQRLHLEERRRIYATALDDIQGEGGFCSGIIAAINSRNLVSLSEPADMTRINKARRKLSRPPLLSFRTVRLSLSRTVERRRSEGQGNPMPLHMVRGHFKVRKSGIYWWSPFWRGDAAAGVVSRKGYEVVA